MPNTPPVSRLALAAGLALALVLAGCATPSGTNFPMTRSSVFQPGKTTRAEVQAIYGVPQKTETLTVTTDIVGTPLAAPMILQTLSYGYSVRGDAAASDEGIGGRWSRVFLRDETLVGYRSESNFPLDSTDVDLERARSIRRGETTEQDVIGLFGRPPGRGIYPLAASPGGRALFYGTVLSNTPPGYNTTKSLSVYVNAMGIVEHFNVSTDAKAIPVAPTPMVIPVYIPRSR